MIGWLRIRRIKNVPIVSELKWQSWFSHSPSATEVTTVYCVWCWDMLDWRDSVVLLGVTKGWEGFCIELKGIWPSVYKPRIYEVYSRHNPFWILYTTLVLCFILLPSLLKRFHSSPWNREHPNQVVSLWRNKTLKQTLEQRLAKTGKSTGPILGVNIKLENLEAKGDWEARCAPCVSPRKGPGEEGHARIL